MFYQIRSYFRFLWRSTNQHGVHSPFVYGLVTRCFYDRKKHAAYEMLSHFRRSLRSNRTQIEMKDLGAGSRVFSSSKRIVTDIAKNAGITPKRARLLNRLVRYLEVERALELGTSLGLGTAAMAAENKVIIQTIEGCPATAAIAEEHFQKFGLDNIELLQGEFDAVLDKLENQRATEESMKAERKITSTLLEEEVAGNAAMKMPISRDAVGNKAEPFPASALEVQDLSRKQEVPQEEATHLNSASEAIERAAINEARQQNRNFEVSDKTETNPSEGITNQWIEKDTLEKDTSEKDTPEKDLMEFSEKGFSRGNKRSVHPNREPIRDNTYSLVFFDGNHQKEATLRYFEKMLPFAQNNSVFIFDDIHWSREMEEAWEQIKGHPSVRVSIDTFQWGLVFFRREQAREHFVIRV